PDTRAVHMTAAAWTSPVLRERVLALLDEGRIDTVQIDLKDESGIVGFDTSVKRAHDIGAVTAYVDLEEVVRTVEDRGGRVIGRIVAFRDPRLARAAWAAGEAD